MTRITNADIPGVPNYDENAAARPWVWHGSTAPDGDAAPWKDATLGSLYVCITAGSVYLYAKYAHAEADADWGMLARTGGTITGDMTITGTLTAGDVSIA